MSEFQTKLHSVPPQTHRAPPRPTTMVCKVSTALLKNSIRFSLSAACSAALKNKNYSAAFSSDRSISYRSKLSSCATTCCRFRRRVDKNLSTSKVFFLSASARYL